MAIVSYISFNSEFQKINSIINKISPEYYYDIPRLDSVLNAKYGITINEFKNSLKEKVKLSNDHFELGVSFALLDKLDKSLYHLDKAIILNEELDLAYFHRAIVKRKKILGIYKNNSIDRYRESLTEKEAKIINSSLYDISKVIHRTGDPGAYLFRAIIWSDQNKISKALADVEIVLNKQPYYFEALALKAELYGIIAEESLNSKNFDLAKSYAFEAKEILDYLINQKQMPQYYYMRGHLSNTINNFEYAIRDFTTSIELDEKYYPSYLGRGLSYYYLLEYEKSLEDYNHYLSFNNNSQIAHINRGTVFLESHRYAKAKEDFSFVINQDSLIWEAYEGRGQALTALSKYELAIKDYNVCTQIIPDRWETYFLKAIVYQKWNKPNLAIENIKKARALSINNEKINLLYYELMDSSHLTN